VIVLNLQSSLCVCVFSRSVLTRGPAVVAMTSGQMSGA